jgi:hypothetical protein
MLKPGSGAAVGSDWGSDLVEDLVTTGLRACRDCELRQY